jgi:hypothetical protein
LKTENAFKKFDKIIVDEFQDLCTKERLEILNILLVDGLCEGKFSFYGDFSRQAIFNESGSLDLLGEYAYFTRLPLSINCRNTINIGKELLNITGFEDKNYKLNILGEKVRYHVWATEEEEAELLKTSIEKYKGKGSIMVLSLQKRKNSVVGKYDADFRHIIGNYGEEAKCHAKFATVQSFKGLESEIVILIDIDDRGYSNKKLMYVALSRARSKLIVLESKAAKRQRE